MLERIVFHWTGGSYTTRHPNEYHVNIDNLGNVFYNAPPERNVPKNGKFLVEGVDKYLPHCGGGNSRCIGIGFMGMAGFDMRARKTAYPLTATQCERGWFEAAKFCHKYKIPITKTTVETHAEFGKRSNPDPKNPVNKSFGKIDILYLPYQSTLRPNEIGDFIREKVEWYLKNKVEKGIYG